MVMTMMTMMMIVVMTAGVRAVCYAARSVLASVEDVWAVFQRALVQETTFLEQIALKRWILVLDFGL
eukprot:692673-Rhodomonas_salina.1